MKFQKGFLAATFMTLLAVGAVATVSINNKSEQFATLNSVHATAPTNTRRIWIIDNNGGDGNTSWWTGSTMYAHVYNGSIDETIKVEHQVLVADNGANGGYYKGLWYVDVTGTGVATSLTVQMRVGNTDGAYVYKDNNQAFAQTLGAIGTADTIWLNDGVNWDSGASHNSRNSSLGTTNGFSAGQLATILAGYNTCSSTNTYGYNSFPQLDTNFFDKCTEDVLTSTTTLADYDYTEYVNNGKDYDKINKDHTSTIKDKVEGLEYWYNHFNA